MSRQRNPQCCYQRCTISMVFTKLSANICFSFLGRILILVLYTNQNPPILCIYFPFITPAKLERFQAFINISELCRRLPIVFLGSATSRKSHAQFETNRTERSRPKLCSEPIRCEVGSGSDIQGIIIGTWPEPRSFYAKPKARR